MRFLCPDRPRAGALLLTSVALLSGGAAFSQPLQRSGLGEVDTRQLNQSSVPTGFLPSPTTPLPLSLRENLFQLTARAAVAYDDNIFRATDQSGNKDDELIVSPAASLDVARILGTTQVAVSGQYGYDVFTFHPDRSRPRLTVGGRATADIAGTCGITPYADYRRERTDFGDINAAVDNTSRQARFGALATCLRPAGFFPSLAFERFSTRNDDRFDFADQTTRTYIVGIGYRRPSLGQLQLYYRRDDTDRPTIGTTNTTDRFGVSFDRSISSLLSASIDLNLLSVRSTDPQVSDYTGPGWRVQLVSRAFSPLRIEATTARTIVNDTLLTNDFVLQSSYGVGVSAQISGLTGVSAGVDYRTRDFRAAPELVRGGLSSDDYILFRAGIQRRLSDRIVLRGDVSHTKRLTTPTIADFDANRITASADYRF